MGLPRVGRFQLTDDSSKHAVEQARGSNLRVYGTVVTSDTCSVIGVSAVCRPGPAARLIIDPTYVLRGLANMHAPAGAEIRVADNSEC
jgi:hypothetical protein